MATFADVNLDRNNLTFTRTRSNGSISSLSNLSSAIPTTRTPPKKPETKTTNSRLQKLYKQTQKLNGLQTKLLRIKKTNFIKRLCALSIIQNGKVAYKLFIDSEQERAFKFLQQTFEHRSIELYQQYTEQNCTGAIYKIFDLMELTFTLFIKPSNNNEKFMVFLLKNKQNINEIRQFRSMDILQTLIGEMCHSLQQQKTATSSKTKAAQVVSSSTVLIEIAEEVFGGGSECLCLDEGEFGTSMTVRLGMEAIWFEHTKDILSDLFYAIIESIENKQTLYARERAAINFHQFVHYFNQMNLNKDVCKIWKDIKSAIQISPLSQRNKAIREQMDNSVMKTKEKLMKLEKLVNILEEILIFDEMLQKDEEVFWRQKLLRHRQVIRLFQDAILNQILEQNEKLKSEMSDLMKIKETKDKNDLHEIETKYYALLATQRQQQIAMKECELLIKRKDDQIHELKSQLTTMNISRRGSKSEMNSVDDDINDELLRLKGEIAQKKLHVTRQLNAMKVSMDETIKT